MWNGISPFSNRRTRKGRETPRISSGPLRRELLMLRNDRDRLSSLQVLQNHQQKIVDWFRNRDLIPVWPHEFRVPPLDQPTEIADLGYRGFRNRDRGRKESKPYGSSSSPTINELFEQAKRSNIV